MQHFSHDRHMISRWRVTNSISRFLGVITTSLVVVVLLSQPGFAWVQHYYHHYTPILPGSSTENASTNGDENCRSRQLAKPIVTSAKSAKEGESVVFTIKKPRRTYSAVRYKFRTENGTAGAYDYVSRSGVLTFNRFDTSKEIRVQTLRDHRAEGSETFTLELHSPQVNFTPQIQGAWETPYQPCPSRWYEGFDRLPRTHSTTAVIIDLSGTSYENQKYGAGYTGQVWGE